MKKTVCELFAGVGGFRLGLNNSKHNDWKFVFANQWEPNKKEQDAYNCYIKKFGESKYHSKEDIGKIDKNSIPNHNLLVAGFPCQDYSVARTGTSNGIEGKKGVLWWQLLEVIKRKSPKFLLFENVDRLLKSPKDQRGRDFGVIIYSLLKENYSLEWRVINAAEYGHVQKRRRVFIFAYKNTTKYYKRTSKYSSNNIIFKSGLFSKTFPIINESKTLKKSIPINILKYNDLKDISDNFSFNFLNTGYVRNGNIYTVKTTPIENEKKMLKSILEEDVDPKYFFTETQWKRIQELKRSSSKTKISKNGGHKYTITEGNISFPDSPAKPARTIITSEGSINRSTHVIEIIRDKLYRKLTPLEVEKINGFNGEWTEGMSDRMRYFCMGNSLVVGVVTDIGNVLGKIIKSE